MSEKDLKRLLLKNQTPKPNPDEIEKVKKIVISEQKQILLIPSVSLWERITQQFFYISKVTWFIQLFIILTALASLTCIDHKNIPALLACLAPLVGVAVFPELLKGFYYNMWELEQSCRFNLREITAVRLLIFGITDLIGVILLSAVAMQLDSVSFMDCILYFLIPFNLANVCYLAAIQIAGRSCPAYLFVAVSLFLSGFASIYARLLDHLKFKEAHTILHFLTTVLGSLSLLFLVYMVIRILKIFSKNTTTDLDNRREHLWN